MKESDIPVMGKSQNRKVLYVDAHTHKALKSIAAERGDTLEYFTEYALHVGIDHLWKCGAWGRFRKRAKK